MNHQHSMITKIEHRTSTICIIGLGYVGLPTAVQFAEKGFRVLGADVHRTTVDMINRGECPLTDLDLDDRVERMVSAGNLRASADVPATVAASDIVLIIVPTPVRPDRQPDLSYVMAAGESCAAGMRDAPPGKLIILESTVYPGVTEDILLPILESTGLKAGIDFGLAYCPERYNPGDPHHTIERVARIVGAMDGGWGEATRMLYAAIVQEPVTLVKNIRTAEAAKVIENTQRDLNIGLMNELAMIFERMGIDIMEVIEAARTKWNFNVYYPGAGVGGHCLPVDPYYLVKKAEELGYHSRIITAGRAINDHMPTHVYEMTVEALNANMRALKGSRIVILGLSYKENVGDLRESPVQDLIHRLGGMDAHITVIDPFISTGSIETFGVTAARDVMEAARDADALILMTAHHQFRDLDLDSLRGIMRTPVFIDGRRMFPPEAFRGFTYRAIGRDRKLD